MNTIACSPTSAIAVVSVVADPNKQHTNQQQKFIKMKQYSAFNSPKSSREGSLTLWDLHSGQKKVSGYSLFDIGNAVYLTFIFFFWEISILVMLNMQCQFQSTHSFSTKVSYFRSNNRGNFCLDSSFAITRFRKFTIKTLHSLCLFNVFLLSFIMTSLIFLWKNFFPLYTEWS